MKGKRKPVQRRRLLVTPSDELMALIEEVHGLTGMSRAGIVADMLDTVGPVFQSQIQALRLLHEAPREAQRLLANQNAAAVASLMQAELDLDAAIDGRTVKGKARKARGRKHGTP